jgi:large subunit ribosomal protein L28
VRGKCDLCGKAVAFGHNVSHSNRKTNRMWRPNIQKALVIINGVVARVHACTRCIRTSKKQSAA